MRLKNFSLNFGTQIFKALADESRIRILSLIIQNKTMCISDLEHILDFTQTKTSRHMAYLKNAGLISPRKVDQWVFYNIKDEAFDLLMQVFNYLEKDALLIKDMETYRILFSNRELAANRIQTKRWSSEN